VLGLLLVLLLGTSRRGRRVLVPALVMVATAIWLVGSIEFQAQTPLTNRVQSLSPSQLQTNAEDRYRLDERVNVIAEIKRHPVAGIGVQDDWKATARPLPVEHENGRQYVHFALLWWWMKLGLLGAIAFVSLVLGGLLLSWRTWRQNREPLFRCFGLASLCGIAGLVAVETTASFTGVDARFTVVLAAQLGLLAALQRGVDRTP
jgi:O-antigen ligase